MYHYAANNPVRYTDPDGRAKVYFLYTYNTRYLKNRILKNYERDSINEEVEFLKQNNITVVVVENAGKKEIAAAFSDPEVELIVISGHGEKTGGVSTEGGGTFYPKDLEGITVSDSLKTLILENCYQGGSKKDETDNKEKWETALKDKVEVVAWQGTTSVFETRRFNNSGKFDRQEKKLKSYCEDVVARNKNEQN